MKQGFSLVELSIVLVILGLLTGGVLTGQSLIRAAELRSVTTEYEKYTAAVHTFRDKYFALPGDMTNAESFWGTAHATDATCITTVGTGTQTCNGDGDGNIGEVSTRSNEMFRFWQHLANAGLVEGTYNGVAGAGGNSDSVLGTNSPKGRMSNGGWFLLGQVFSGNATVTDGDYDDALTFGADTVGGWNYAAILKPEEAWNIDTKMDDGKPQQGKVWAVRWDSCTDAATSAVLTANYDLTNTSIDCALAFLNAF